jgi:hypothetical protein
LTQKYALLASVIAAVPLVLFVTLSVLTGLAAVLALFKGVDAGQHWSSIDYILNVTVAAKLMVLLAKVIPIAAFAPYLAAIFLAYVVILAVIKLLLASSKSAFLRRLA